MNRFINQLGGNTPYNDDFRLIQDNAISGLTSIVKTIINTSYVNSQIILWGVNPVLISGGTSSSYFQVSAGAIWDGTLQEIVMCSPQTLSQPSLTSLNQLWINTTQTQGGLTQYTNLQKYYNYTNNIATLSLTGSSNYQYINYVPFQLTLSDPTGLVQSISLVAGQSYSVNANSVYDTITSSSLTGSTTITIPAATTSNSGLYLWLDFNLGLTSFFTSCLIQDLNSNVIGTIGSGSDTPYQTTSYISKWLLVSNGTTWKIVQKFNTKTGGGNINLPTATQTPSISDSSTYITPQILLNLYPLKSIVVPIPPVNMNTSNQLWVSGGTFSFSYIYNVQAVIISDDQTKYYPMVTGFPGTQALQNSFIAYWYQNGIVNLVWSAASSQFGTLSSFTSTSNNRGYLIYQYI